jgi:hypothetical protein
MDSNWSPVLNRASRGTRSAAASLDPASLRQRIEMIFLDWRPDSTREDEIND